jgi:DHA1 family bicyclomycin/chloramphenicol resistance-like MFS transporter
MPVLAPNIGLAILLVASWEAIFVALAVYALVMLAWSGMRLPETLHPEYRRSLKWADMVGAVWETARESQSRGYTIALTISFGALVAYIASIQQIVFEAFHQPHLIGIVFAAIAAPMALASWTNSRVVGRFGLRRVGHIATLAFTIIALIHAGFALAGRETLVTFVVLQALTMCAFAFTSSNLSTLAMEHMAPIAGTASSVQGMVGTIGGAILGFIIGQYFDGTVVPYLIGTAVCATGGFVALLLTEPKRLFAPIEADPLEQEAALESPAIPEDLA